MPHTQQPHQAPVILDALFQHLITIDVAAIGFLVTLHGHDSPPPEIFSMFGLSIAAFGISLVVCLLGLISRFSAAAREQYLFSRLRFRARSFFMLAWLFFLVGLVSFLALIFTR